KKRNPDAKVAVIGCFAQLKPEELNLFEEVDLILGNNEKYQLYDHLDKILRQSSFPKEKFLTSEILKSEKFFPAYSSGDRTRSFLKIQDGCDYFCAYCTIPLARGLSRSNSIAQTMETAREIAESDAKEIILTGVNIGDFGKQHQETLFALMQELENLDGIERIRLSSIEPDLLTDEMIALIHVSNKFLPHFHIPLQSGSDEMLKVMNRKYDLALFDSRIKKISSLMPDACIAADIIVGFPGETDEDFNITAEYVKGAPLSYVHVFTYSSRPNTRASKMGGIIASSIKKERSKKLHVISKIKKQYFYHQNTGKTVDVLFESDHHDGSIQGWSENYIRVKVDFDKTLINKIIQVKLEEIEQDQVFRGKIL
ncbi:MAG: MiaB/RimO family radical SAM methylthiotransferase, partial [Bacteroidota bacterium]|nr:MiaB/RimO family radical SAM methylthiotransferase [Bacteroidota bacterium]